MTITKDRLFVAFAIYSGAWLCVSLAQWGLLSLQAIVRSSIAGTPPFDLYSYGVACGLIVAMLCAPVVSRAPLLLALLFSAFGLLFRFANYVFEVIYRLTTEPAYQDQYYVSVELPWRDIGSEALGYVLGAALLAVASLAQRKLAPEAGSPYQAFLNWLQIDSGVIRDRLPGFNKLGSHLGKITVALCCLAAAQSLADVTSLLLTAPFMQQMMSSGYAPVEPLRQFVIGYAPTIVLLTGFGHVAGRLARQMQLEMSVMAICVATILCFAHDIETIVSLTSSLFVSSDNVGEYGAWIAGLLATILAGASSLYRGYSRQKPLILAADF
ncbi:hypothetical protein [Kordiimonas lacus]|uniref:Uncharacterized protein n=1 Tax=Kordiimonas lacus TaxID=637679 RepID=A0A1G7B622_9PROT|nr:hypothetical protein [Kordiimonas lacus]SDE22310.1 hypothetical protein SAMN04488071_2371 [Kordiimonas lacus]